MQSFTCSKTSSVWSLNVPTIPILKFISPKAGCRTLGYCLLVFTLARMPVFAAGSATLIWDTCNDSCVAGYNVYYGGASGAYTNKICAGTATNAAIPGLILGCTYYFAVTSYTALGLESPFSSEVALTVGSTSILSVTTVKSNSVLTSVTVSATGGVPSSWALQSSRDLKTWTTIAQGTNAPVNVPVSVGSLPMQFFRLLSQ
jgi:hypothetical protein